MRWLSLLVVVACTAPPPREALVLRIAVWGPLGEFSPLDESLASIATPWVFEKLVSVDDSGEMTPALAIRVERLSGRSIRVHLRPDATFSDGTPVTDDDVARSLQPSGLAVTRAGEALLIEPRESGMPVDALLLQAHVFRRSAEGFVGSGPFAVASRSETELRLVRRRPLPERLNEVRLVAYSTTKEAFAHTLKGDANAIVDLESRWLEFFRDVPSLRIVRGVGHGTDGIMFNGKLEHGERVRLARALASQQIRDLAFEEGECAERGGNADAPLPGSGPALRILSWGPFGRLALAARRVLGDRAEVIDVSVPAAMNRLRTGDYEMLPSRPIRWPPSAIALAWRTGATGNLSGYSNAVLDRAIEAADWATAEAVLRDDPPASFICTRGTLAAIDTRIKNPRLGPYELLETLPEWEVAR